MPLGKLKYCIHQSEKYIVKGLYFFKMLRVEKGKQHFTNV